MSKDLESAITSKVAKALNKDFQELVDMVDIEIKRLGKAHKAEITKLKKAHSEEIAEMKGRVDDVVTRVIDCNIRLVCKDDECLHFDERYRNKCKEYLDCTFCEIYKPYLRVRRGDSTSKVVTARRNGKGAIMY